MTNPNTTYAQILVGALAMCGLRHVCIAPGSRSTPLTLAFAKTEGIQKHTHLDERSAAFYALGLARAADSPVALVCTSGTAGANFFPAIIEAHQSHIPLLILTADRPHELRHSGANQTMDQVKLYGDYVLWFVDMALPEANSTPSVLRNLAATAARAIAIADGTRKGVVHLNLPFRKPLEPDEPTKDYPHSDTVELVPVRFTKPTRQASQFALPPDLPDLRSGKTLIVCGPQRGSSSVPRTVYAFADATGAPVAAEAASGMRYFDAGATLIAATDWYLPSVPVDKLQIETVVQFGGVPTGKALNDFLARIAPLRWLYVSESTDWADDTHRITDFILMSPNEFCDLWLTQEKATTTPLLEHMQALEALTWQNVDAMLATGPYFDGSVVHDVIEDMPDDSLLFVGNSLPIRLVDQFGAPQPGKRIRVFANRGTSGIDGNLSAALGTGAAYPGKPLVAIVGDVTFYHDMNGLLAVQRNKVPITIVLLNNDGGGIFHRLPISQFDPAFTEYFVMPHGLDFSHAAKLYGLDYVLVEDRAAFRDVFQASVRSQRAQIIEVRTDARHDLEQRQTIMDAVHQAIYDWNLQGV